MATRSSRSRRQLSFEDTRTDVDRREQAAEQSLIATDICALCKDHRKSMSRVETWQNVEACDLVAKKGIKPTNLVCPPCRDDVRRVVVNPTHVPRWEKKKQHIKCCVKGCSELHFVLSKKTDTDKLNTIFAENRLQTEGDIIPIPTPLCKQHYYIVYNWVQPQQTNCPTCGVSLKHVKSRQCPNPEII